MFADPSRCWEGEDPVTRFEKVGHLIDLVHVKDLKGKPVRSMQASWPARGMRFTRLGDGQLDLVEFMQLMERIGWADRYMANHGTNWAPLVADAEDEVYNGDDVSAHAAEWMQKHLIGRLRTGSFQDDMGAAKS